MLRSKDYQHSNNCIGLLKPVMVLWLPEVTWLWNLGLDRVINISLTGPDNQLLAAAVSRLRERGVLMVAAVGNQGPSAPPLYPAAYTDVIGVTAADSSGKLYRWANRGEQVMFASNGVTVPVAHPDAGMVADSGTSLASPVVAAAPVSYTHLTLPTNREV